MSAVTDRFDAAVVKLGETVSWTKLAGSTSGQPYSHSCIVRSLDGGTLSTYLDDVEIMGVVKPGLALTCKQSIGAVAVNDTFNRDSRSFTVLKVFLNRMGNELVTKTVIAA